MKDLPGGDLVSEGLSDLGSGKETIPALLVSIGAPRLRQAGLEIPTTIADPDHKLYRQLTELHGDDAHSRYNGYIRRLVSFERALECAR